MAHIQSEKVSFPGSGGEALAGRLDRPAGPVRAYALFAHCFSCSKDIKAASALAQALARRGIAVLRFDFTGLGHSEGDFANTNFSSNVEDLVAAADYLRTTFAAPEILIGHSLGGAAAIVAAVRLPDVRAVATVGAPSDPAHVADNFGDAIDVIEADGEAEVTLAGRRFTIKKQFLDDIRNRSVLDCARDLQRPLLAAHAPRDGIVSIDHAGEIFRAAKHPKSFVSLDDADHLLTGPGDAAYVGDLIASWAERYLSPAETVAKPAAGAVVVQETRTGKFTATAAVGDHRLLADEPPSVGGDDAGPSPYDFVSIGLGACTVMTLRMYAERKGLALDRVSAEVRHAKVHCRDLDACLDGQDVKVDLFERALRLEGALSETEQARLLEIADRCPVHRTLEGEAVVKTKLQS